MHRRSSGRRGAAPGATSGSYRVCRTLPRFSAFDEEPKALEPLFDERADDELPDAAGAIRVFLERLPPDVVQLQPGAPQSSVSNIRSTAA